MKRKSLANYLCLFGILSIVFYLLHDLLGAADYPGYDWKSQAVSDLTATDAESFVTASRYSSLYGLFNCLCCAVVCILIKNERSRALRLGVYLFGIMNLISAVGYSLFPLTSSGYDGSTGSFIHVYVITALVVMLSIVSLILIAVGSLRGESKHRLLGVLAIAALVLMFAGAVGSGNVPKEYFGIFERFSTYSAVVFTGILGLYGFGINNNTEVIE